MEEKYYVIHNGEGDTYVREYTKEELLAEIEEGSYDEGIHENLPEDGDTNYWGGHALIIKGTVVTPKAEQVVTKYKID